MGLKFYLNFKKYEHNDFGYNHFVKMAEANRRPDGKYDGVASMGRTFGVSRQTMRSWLKLYDEERNK
jgi:hypothetical protein